MKIVLLVFGEINVVLHVVKRFGILMTFPRVSASFASNKCSCSCTSLYAYHPCLKLVIIIKTCDKIHFQPIGSHVAKDSAILANQKEEEQEIKPRKLNLKSASGKTLLSDFGGGMSEEAKDDLIGINGYAEAVPS